MNSQNSWGGVRAGAGRPGYSAHVESFRHLDARAMQREGLFKQPWSGVWWWKDAISMKTNASIHVRTSETSLWIKYQIRDQQTIEAFRIYKVPCHFGGYRVILECPGCHQRSSLFYLRYQMFRCRGCHGLTYESQSEGRLGRLAIKRSKLAGALGASGIRPRGMHLGTFTKLQSAMIQVDLDIDDYISARS
jgi:hypothetical protein